MTTATKYLTARLACRPAALDFVAAVLGLAKIPHFRRDRGLADPHAELLAQSCLQPHRRPPASVLHDPFDALAGGPKDLYMYRMVLGGA